MQLVIQHLPPFFMKRFLVDQRLPEAVERVDAIREELDVVAVLDIDIGAVFVPIEFQSSLCLTEVLLVDWFRLRFGE